MCFLHGLVIVCMDVILYQFHHASIPQSHPNETSKRQWLPITIMVSALHPRHHGTTRGVGVILGHCWHYQADALRRPKQGKLRETPRGSVPGQAATKSVGLERHFDFPIRNLELSNYLESIQIILHRHELFQKKRQTCYGPQTHFSRRFGSSMWIEQRSKPLQHFRSFCHTGSLIGIFIMSNYNPNITG